MKPPTSLQLNTYFQTQKSYLQSLEDVEETLTPSNSAMLKMLHAVGADVRVTSASGAYQEQWLV